MGAIDPMAVPVPPELGGPIYGWIRRLALQADLIGADKVLREAFVDLTSALSVAIIYPGAATERFGRGLDAISARPGTARSALGDALRSVLRFALESDDHALDATG